MFLIISEIYLFLFRTHVTYISISFYDYDTNQSIAVIKSSGIGWSISQDQKLAYKAIKKELDKVFPQTR